MPGKGLGEVYGLPVGGVAQTFTKQEWRRAIYVSTPNSIYNDWHPDGLDDATQICLDSGGANISIRGIDAGTPGRVLCLTNVGTSGNVTIVDSAGTSLSQNRFLLGGLDNIVLVPGQSILLVYTNQAVAGALSTTWNWCMIGSKSFSSSAPQPVGTAAVGTSANLNRSDHVHATGAGTPTTQAMGDSAATGTGPAAAMTDHLHGMPAFAANEAAIIEDSAGTNGGVATTIARSDHRHNLVTATASPAAVGTAAAGTSGNAPSRSDHVHATGAGTPSTQAFGDAAAVGTGPAASMTDHKHAMPVNPSDASITVTDVTTNNVTTSAHGFAVKAIAPAANQVEAMVVLNAESAPTWRAVTDTTNPAAVGTAAPGTATVVAHRDHVHATGAGTPSTQAIGDAAAVGTGPAASMTDHKHAMPAFGTGPVAVGTQADGSSANIARIDHVHATGAGTPTNTKIGDAAATGTGPAAAMSNHVHGNAGVIGNFLTSATTVNHTVTDTTGGVTLASQTAAAGAAWRLWAFGSYAPQSSATARNAQITPYWGSQALTQNAAAVLINAAVTTRWAYHAILLGISTTSVRTMQYVLNDFTDDVLGNFRETLTGGANVTVSSGAQTIDLKFSMSNATPTDTWTIEAVVIERIA